MESKAEETEQIDLYKLLGVEKTATKAEIVNIIIFI